MSSGSEEGDLLDSSDYTTSGELNDHVATFPGEEGSRLCHACNIRPDYVFAISFDPQLENYLRSEKIGSHLGDTGNLGISARICPLSRPRCLTLQETKAKFEIDAHSDLFRFHVKVFLKPQGNRYYYFSLFKVLDSSLLTALHSNPDR